MFTTQTTMVNVNTARSIALKLTSGGIPWVDGAGEERWQPNSLYITVDRKRERLGKGHRQTDRRQDRKY